MIILHNCGNTKPLLKSLESTRAGGIHLGNQCPIEIALNTLDSNILVFGNIDPVNILKMGTEAEVKEHTMKLLHQTSRFKNFILSSGCDIPPHTPLENLQALFAAVTEFNQKIS